MSSYKDTKDLIEQALVGRPAGTLIQPENHQAYALSLLEYVRSLEMSTKSGILGVANYMTVPLQPDDEYVSYVSAIGMNSEIEFQNFYNEYGQKIKITTSTDSGKFILLFWNKVYWDFQTFDTTISGGASNIEGLMVESEFVGLAAFKKVNLAISAEKDSDGNSLQLTYLKIADRLTLGEISTTAYRGDRGASAYAHSILNNGTNPHGTTFTNLASKPTTIVGYGITDAYTKTEVGSILTNYVAKVTGYDLLATTEAAKIHVQNTDTQLTNGTHVVSLDASGTLHVENISQVGSTYETHAEQVLTKKNTIILRDGAVAGLATGEYVGFTAKLYDGVNDGQLVFDKDGWARVGDVGALAKIAVIEENPVDGNLMYYNLGDSRLESIDPIDLPISSQTQTALEYKANFAGGNNFTGLQYFGVSDVDFPAPLGTSSSFSIATAYSSGGALTANSGLMLTQDYNGTTALTSNVGSYIYSRNNSTASLTTLAGIFAYGRNEGGANVTNILGGYFSARNQAGGIFSKMLGLQAYVTNNSTDVACHDIYGFSSTAINNGAATAMSSLYGEVYNTGGGAISQINVMQLNAYNLTGVTDFTAIEIGRSHNFTGTPTNSYGIYLDASTNRGSGTNYAIYSGSTATSYFAGALKLSKMFVPADSTTAFQISKADGVTTMLSFDTTNGRIGINGITAPGVTVDISGSLRVSSTLYASGIANGLGSIIGFSSTGNVGIGISGSSISSIFQVAQQTTGVGTVSNTAGGTTVTGVGTQFTNTFKIGDTITIGGQTVAISAIASDTSLTTAAITNANTAVSYTLVGGDRFVVKGNGYVGIGTNSPTSPLHIVDTTGSAFKLVTNSAGIGTAVTLTSIGGASTIQLDSSGNSVYRTSQGSIFFDNDNLLTTGGIVFRTRSPRLNRMYISNNGNIGIGTTSPTGLFQVTQPTGGEGTVATNGTTTLTGTNTQFLSAFRIGDTITVSGETIRTISAIASDTSLTVSVAFSTTASSLSYAIVGGNRIIVRGHGKLYVQSTQGDTIPTLGVDNGKLAILNGSNYGIIAGVTNTGDSYLQVQRVDGTATAYNLLLQPSGGGVLVNTQTAVTKLTVAGTGTFNTAENATVLQARTSDYVSTTTGSALTIGFGASTGDTYGRIQAYKAGSGQTADIWINSSGGYTSFGPNTNAAQTIVDVYGANKAIGVSATQLGNLRVSTTDEAAIDKGGSIVLGGRYITGNTAIIAFATIHGKKETATSGGNGGYLAFETSDNSVSPYSLERMRITGTGLVGINTAAPLMPLHVSCSNAKATVATNNLLFLSSNDASANAPFGLRIQLTGAATLASRYIGIQTTDYLNADGGSIILQGNTGYVGIGFTTPSHYLDVTKNNVNQRTIYNINGSATSSILQSDTASTGTDETLTNQYYAWKFTASGAHTVGSLACRLKRTGTITNTTAFVRLKLYSDSGTAPNALLYSTDTIRYGSIGTSYTEFLFGNDYTLTNGTVYWIVVERSEAPVGGTISVDRNATALTTTNVAVPVSADWTVNAGLGYYKVYGQSTISVKGYSTNYFGVSGSSGNGYGVSGSSTTNIGVYGFSGNSTGVYGTCDNGIGIRGISINNTGIYGTSTSGLGVQGASASNYGGDFSSATGGGMRGQSVMSYGIVAKTSGALTANNITSTLLVKRDSTGTYNVSGALIEIVDYPTNSGAISGALISGIINATERLRFDPRVVDGASAVANYMDTSSALSTIGAKLLSLRNNGVEKAFIAFDGSVTSSQYKLSALNTAPTSSSDTGVAGEIRFTAAGVFFCSATNTWVKATFATF